MARRPSRRCLVGPSRNGSLKGKLTIHARQGSKPLRSCAPFAPRARSGAYLCGPARSGARPGGWNGGGRHARHSRCPRHALLGAARADRRWRGVDRALGGGSDQRDSLRSRREPSANGHGIQRRVPLRPAGRGHVLERLDLGAGRSGESRPGVPHPERVDGPHDPARSARPRRQAHVPDGPRATGGRRRLREPQRALSGLHQASRRGAGRHGGDARRRRPRQRRDPVARPRCQRRGGR